MLFRVSLDETRYLSNLTAIVMGSMQAPGLNWESHEVSWVEPNQDDPMVLQAQLAFDALQICLIIRMKLSWQPWVNYHTKEIFWNL